MPICYIVGAGENFGIDFKLKAVDGGINYLEKNIKIDLFVGDLEAVFTNVLTKCASKK